MNLTDICFQRLKKEGKGALVTYFPMGDGNHDAVDLAGAYLENGVDILEIGLPIKNPVLDGKVIADAMQKALHNHPDIEWYFEQVARIRAQYPEAVLELFTYKEVFEALPEADFMLMSVKSGVDCVLITDFDDAERGKFQSTLPDSIENLNFLPFCYTDELLMQVKDKNPQGYVFFQSTDGSTGARASLENGLGEKIRHVKSVLTDVPVCAGFGISTPEHCAQVRGMGADGVIIGSYVVDYVAKHSLKEIGGMMRMVKAAL